MRNFRLHLASLLSVPTQTTYFPVGLWSTDPQVGGAPQYGPGGFDDGLWDLSRGVIVADRHMLVEVHYQLHILTGVALSPAIVGAKWITNAVSSSDPNYAGWAGQWEEAGIGYKADGADGGVAAGSALIQLREGDTCALFCQVTPSGNPISIDNHHCHTWLWGREVKNY